MKRFIGWFFISLFLLLLLFLSFSTLMPATHSSKKKSETEFSTERAFEHVKKIAQKPHYVGSENHSKVRNYIVGQLQKMGLTVHTQNGYVVNSYGILSNPENIVSRLEGSDPQPGSDLLILAHYDSDSHSSFGASDDGSGVAAVLESVRAFLAKDTLQKNNIIICFTDAEEIGLLGAQLFVEQHSWVKDIGLVLNFEARGTSGPSNTIIETNHGNARLIKAFAEAQPKFPMASSLMYEIYKNMPNDTDVTVFREEKDLPSFFFAFIDDHYNYHTANDIPNNLDKNSLAHQGSYLMALLPYLGSHDLSHLKTENEQVYFNFPFFKIIHYDYTWIYPLLILGWLGFFVLILVGFRKRRLGMNGIGKGFLALIISLILCAIIGFYGWKLIQQIYPQYAEIQQGFPYNGHLYITAFVLLGVTVLFAIYKHFRKPGRESNLMVAPLFLWLLMNTGLAIFFKGASYFIIPVLFAEIAFALMIWRVRPLMVMMLILAIPAIFIFSPLIEFVPVALGTDLIFVSLILLVLLFGLLLSIFSYYPRKNWLALLCFVIGLVFIGIAHTHSKFSVDRPKPNSLVYLLNLDNQRASWNTYDHILDHWTENYITGHKDSLQNRSITGSKYGEGFAYTNSAPVKVIPSAQIKIKKDSSEAGGMINYDLKILPRRKTNRIILYTKFAKDIKGFTADGISVNFKNFHSKIRKTNANHKTRLLTYYPVDRDTLRLQFSISGVIVNPSIEIYEASNDLLNNPWLIVPKRTDTMIPRPFVLNDAIVTKKTIKL